MCTFIWHIIRSAYIIHNIHTYVHLKNHVVMLVTSHENCLSLCPEASGIVILIFVIYVTHYEFKFFPMLHDVGYFLTVKNQTAMSSSNIRIYIDKNILDESYQLVKHFPDFPLWEYRIA